MFRWPKFALVALGFALLVGSAVANADQQYGFGRSPSAAEIAGWNIDVRGDGKGLPPGHGSVAQGDAIYAAKCASCHGDFGEGGGRMPELAGGKGSLAKADPVKTVGSYWPYAPTLFDYIRRAMPFSKPQSLSDDEVYAVTAFILNLNSIVPKDAVLDAKSLAAIKMPNRDGFVKDPRPDVHNVACMSNCKGGVRITSDMAKHLSVTPGLADAPAPSAVPAAVAPSAVAPAAVAFSQVAPIIAQRCAVCHAQKPTQSGFASAPAGVKLDTPERIHAAAAAINQQAVLTRAMPIGNMTNMTQAERALLGRWIAAGAKI